MPPGKTTSGTYRPAVLPGQGKSFMTQS